MSDGQEKKTTEQRWVTIDTYGKVGSSRYHLFRDCSFISTVDEETVTAVGERESTLLGLKVCSLCERRKTGGPAVEALEGFFGEDHDDTASTDPRDVAWRLVNYLRERNFYIAQRGAKK